MGWRDGRLGQSGATTRTPGPAGEFLIKCEALSGCGPAEASSKISRQGCPRCWAEGSAEGKGGAENATKDPAGMATALAKVAGRPVWEMRLPGWIWQAEHRSAARLGQAAEKEGSQFPEFAPKPLAGQGTLGWDGEDAGDGLVWRDCRCLSSCGCSKLPQTCVCSRSAGQTSETVSLGLEQVRAGLRGEGLLLAFSSRPSGISWPVALSSVFEAGRVAGPASVSQALPLCAGSPMPPPCEDLVMTLGREARTLAHLRIPGVVICTVPTHRLQGSGRLQDRVQPASQMFGGGCVEGEMCC